MRVLHLVAGAGGMYCGSCLQGNTTVAALRGLGVDAVLLPLYTPLRTDGPDMSLPRVALGGINVYLQQHLGLFRHTPRLVDRLLDRPGLLRLAARAGAATQPERLGALVVSMLRGEKGRQRKAIDELVRTIETELRPQIVHLNNALLAGLVRPLVRRLGLPVVCTLAGEDAFLARLAEPWQTEALGLLRERLPELSSAVACNRYYARQAAELFGLHEQQITIVPPGIEPGPFQKARQAARAKRPDSTAGGQPQDDPRPTGPGGQPRPLRIGFLARVCADKGLDLLLEAAARLAADPAVGPFRLLAAGYLHPAERHYLGRIVQRAAAAGLGERFEYLGELDAPAKARFLASLDVFVLPARWPESKGLPVLEAWAAGLPVVVPASGTFPEWIEQHGGGLLFAPKHVGQLAAALKRLADDVRLREQLGREGWQAVCRKFHAGKMAGELVALYQRVLASPRK